MTTKQSTQDLGETFHNQPLLAALYCYTIIQDSKFNQIHL